MNIAKLVTTVLCGGIFVEGLGGNSDCWSNCAPFFVDAEALRRLDTLGKNVMISLAARWYHEKAAVFF